MVDQGRGGPAAHLSPLAAGYGASLFFSHEESALSEMTIGKWFRGPNRYRRRNSSITALFIGVAETGRLGLFEKQPVYGRLRPGARGYFAVGGGTRNSVAPPSSQASARHAGHTRTR